ncbi:hypothetical protein E4K73_47915 [Streptomyces sp. IB201691-2A2]|nr:hypothetical protein E4K73_47915 [Streptomyces sp. IB201691-2A2]
MSNGSLPAYAWPVSVKINTSFQPDSLSVGETVQAVRGRLAVFASGPCPAAALSWVLKADDKQVASGNLNELGKSTPIDVRLPSNLQKITLTAKWADTYTCSGAVFVWTDAQLGTVAFPPLR